MTLRAPFPCAMTTRRRKTRASALGDKLRVFAAGYEERERRRLAQLEAAAGFDETKKAEGT